MAKEYVTVNKCGELIVDKAGIWRDKIEKIEIPEGVTRIPRGAFQGCDSLKTVVLPDSVQRIDVLAFCCCCALTSINLPNSLKTIGSASFAFCNHLKTVVVPDSVQRIGDRAFWGCSGLESVKLSDALVCIPCEAFRDCSALTNVRLPSGLKTIDESSFYGCDKLKTVILPSSLQEIISHVFGNVREIVASRNTSEALDCAKELRKYDHVKEQVFGDNTKAATAEELMRKFGLDEKTAFGVIEKADEALLNESFDKSADDRARSIPSNDEIGDDLDI